MKILLETVRGVLKNALGRNSFIASFVTRVEESEQCPTASIDRNGVLRYNPAFANRYLADETDLFCLVLHEILHPMFGHFIYKNGPLENLGADTVINACVSQLFARASGEGSLFMKFYRPEGMEGLLRPQSRMGDSRYGRLYDVFYGYGRGQAVLSTGEVIQALKVLAPPEEAAAILMLGSHGSAEEGGKDGSGLCGLPAETLCRFAEDLKKNASIGKNVRAGFGEFLYQMFLEAVKTHLSIRKVLLQHFVTQRKLDRFRHEHHRAAITTSPVPLHPSKRDFVLLAAGIPPFHYHNRTQRVSVQEKGLAVYLDVSGSVNEHLPKIVGVLSSLRDELTTIFLFSNAAIEVPFKTLLAGQIRTTYGTDFDCIADSLLEKDFDKAIILTDGYADLKEEKQAELKKRKLQILTVLFGGKEDCEEFAPFGDVVQLEDITN